MAKFTLNLLFIFKFVLTKKNHWEALAIIHFKTMFEYDGYK